MIVLMMIIMIMMTINDDDDIHGTFVCTCAATQELTDYGKMTDRGKMKIDRTVFEI